MSTSEAFYEFRGEETFRISGSERGDDTLWIDVACRQTENPMRLRLPTLAITYADLAFANAVGGAQRDYPESRPYGAAYFTPPVVIAGEDEVRKRTWIRGAQRVTIGPEHTEIEWPAWRPLVIPRLRIARKVRAPGALVVEGVRVTVDQPFIVELKQYADGRHVGGVRIEKRHPDAQPEPPAPTYDLRIRVIDGRTLEPVPEARVRLLRRHPKTGELRLVARPATDGRGTIELAGRPAGEIEAVTLDRPGWRAVARTFRPLPGQRVHLLLRVWRLAADEIDYRMRRDDSAPVLARLAGCSVRDLLIRNGLSDAADLAAGMRLSLPCHAASYRLERGDTFEWLARAFAYPSVEELAKLNGLVDPSALHRGLDIRLPGWRYVYALSGESLRELDKRFGVLPGCCRPVGRAARPASGRPLTGETVAVPSPDFVRNYLRR